MSISIGGSPEYGITIIFSPAIHCARPSTRMGCPCAAAGAIELHRSAAAFHRTAETRRDSTHDFTMWTTVLRRTAVTSRIRGGERSRARSDAQDEPLVAIRRDLIASLPIGPDAADVRHEHAWLAGDIRPHVPGIRQRIQRSVADVVDVGYPRVLGVPGSLDAAERPRAEMREALGDPVDVLLDGHDHIAQHGRAARAGDGEEVREALHGETEVGARPLGPQIGRASCRER